MSYSSKKKTDKQKSADGFLNLSIELPDGSTIRLQKGVPLDAETRIGRSLLNAAASNDDFTVTCTGTVHAVTDDADNAEDIIFG